MDVTVPAIPESYDAYRAELRVFIEAHKPELVWKQRTGVRVPDLGADVALLRAYVGELYDAGYRLERFAGDGNDGNDGAVGAAGMFHPYEQRI